MSDREGAVTRMLIAASSGDEGARDKLWELTYDEMHTLAERMMRGERAGHTLAPADLIGEVYIRLVDANELEWRDRAHFFGIAARAFRRILIDHARRRGAQKRGGGRARVTIDRVQVAADGDILNTIALDDALERLEALAPRLCRVVELRYFGGLSEEETAELLGITARTVRRDWVKAKGLLYGFLTDPRVEGHPG
jgi:RNA polymerase sigma-70 factor (ECF subfamily)